MVEKKRDDTIVAVPMLAASLTDDGAKSLVYVKSDLGIYLGAMSTPEGLVILSF